MNFLLDLFTNWTFDKVLDYTLAAVIWSVFKSRSKQNKYPGYFEKIRRYRDLHPLLRSLSMRVLLSITIHPYMFS